MHSFSFLLLLPSYFPFLKSFSLALARSSSFSFSANISPPCKRENRPATSLNSHDYLWFLWRTVGCPLSAERKLNGGGAFSRPCVSPLIQYFPGLPGQWGNLPPSGKVPVSPLGFAIEKFRAGGNQLVHKPGISLSYTLPVSISQNYVLCHKLFPHSVPILSGVFHSPVSWCRSALHTAIHAACWSPFAVRNGAAHRWTALRNQVFNHIAVVVGIL